MALFSQWERGLLAAAIMFLLAASGCGDGKPALREMQGAVTCGGEPVPLGQVTFVPIEGTPGLPTPAIIAGGRYQIKAPGGVPTGKHRVQVEARKKTGRKVQGFNGVETTQIDEETPIGPAVYAGEQSPLTVEVRAAGDGRFDISLPAR